MADALFEIVVARRGLDAAVAEQLADRRQGLAGRKDAGRIRVRPGSGRLRAMALARAERGLAPPRSAGSQHSAG
ncbi:MAG: hypothetical protein OXH59_10080 [Rhodospirillaceae bacterium]|nr:hypothetical protein [Rhodospirillaceae bacterium]